MAVHYRDGDVSYMTAAKILRCTYHTVAALVQAGKLEGGRYRGKQRGRYVTLASVRRLHHEKLTQQAATYIAARNNLEGVVP